MNRKILCYSIFLAVLSIVISCSGRSEKKKPGVAAENEEAGVAKKLIEVLSPADNASFALNAKISFSVVPAAGNPEIDSVQFWFDGSKISTVNAVPASVEIDSKTVKTTGRKALRAVAFRKGIRPQTVTLFIAMVSDIDPVMYTFRIKKSYSHDKKAFTQGLVWDNGIFIEGTGEYGESSLRKVEPETGNVLSQVNLDSELFGEGVAIMDDHIYQLTWKSKVGFIYSKETLSQISKIYYQTEGWGLTTSGDKLIMSDGTNTLWFLDKEFNVISSLEVWDNKGKVDNLNELEMIEGELWANIWTTDRIARIDPATGKVLGYIDLNNILPKNERRGNEDVLNGIAYDAAGKRIFITGKYWPMLFEIEVIKKKQILLPH